MAGVGLSHSGHVGVWAEQVGLVDVRVEAQSSEQVDQVYRLDKCGWQNVLII